MTVMAKHARLSAAWALLSENPVLPFPQRRLAREVDIEAVLAAKSHAPVVYFVRVGRNVKIGTTAKLRERLMALYLGPEDVLAVVSGGKDAEDAYHRYFAASRIVTAGRAELFRLSLRLRWFLARRRLELTEVLGSLGIGSVVALVSGRFVFGVAACAAGIGLCFARPGWEWR
jgi:hypothetical protein